MLQALCCCSKCFKLSDILESYRGWARWEDDFINFQTSSWAKNGIFASGISYQQPGISKRNSTQWTQFFWEILIVSIRSPTPSAPSAKQNGPTALGGGELGSCCMAYGGAGNLITVDGFETWLRCKMLKCVCTYICWEERGVVVMSLSATLLQLSSQNDVAKTSGQTPLPTTFLTCMLHGCSILRMISDGLWSSGYFGMLSFCSSLSFRVSQRLEDITTTGMKAAV